MGHPKRQRKKYEKPKKPFDKQRIEAESRLMKEFGLRRKHELWRAASMLRGFRSRAREIQAAGNEAGKKELLEYLVRLGLVKETSGLDDVLELKLEDILKRRLQTLLFRKGLAHSISHARQLITHRHVKLGEQKTVWPSTLVRMENEGEIILTGIHAQKETK